MKSKNKKTLYLVDGSAYIYRAFHAIRGLKTSSGRPTNAVFGFTKMLIKLMEDKTPEYVAMFFDAKGPTFRHDMYSEYKANRPPMPDDLVHQLPYIKDVTKGFNIPVFEMTGFEADDLIGTLARKAEEKGFLTVMVTGDKDFFQLVTEQSIIWDPMKDKTTDYDTVKETFGVDPCQMIDVMGLSGDTADNVPGVPGIGQKTALGLIKEFQNMDTLYDQVETITKKKQKENLISFKDQAFLSRQLVTITTDAPIAFEPEKFIVKEPDNEKLEKLYKELEFRQLRQDAVQKADLSKKKYTAILDEKSLNDLIAQLEEAETFAIDTETTSLDPMAANLVGLSFSTQIDEAFYIPIAHDYTEAPTQLALEQVLASLKPVLENPSIEKTGQNIKYDWIILSRNGIDLKGVCFDTMLASYLLNASKRVHSLDQIALDYLDHKTISYEDVAGKGKKAVGFNKVPLEKGVPYACEDADITLMAQHVLKPKLEDAGLIDLFETIELPLVQVLKQMEMNGIYTDKEKLRSLSQSFGKQLEEIEADIYLQAGEAFNIKSSQQLGHILFDKLELPVQKKTKKTKGYSTDVNVLTTLSEMHELPKLILNHRTLAKLKSTYTDALFELINPETSRIHTSFNQTITATGRLSSSDPNLQNIPVRTEEGREIRKAFIPRDGWHMLSADYSQIELRVLAHYSNDSILIKAFKDDEDIHTRTAEEVFQVLPTFLTKDLRDQAKVINFGIIYGMSPFGLSRELGISQKMAKNYIDSYFNRHKGVKQFIDSTIEEARKTGNTTTLFKRIRSLPDINSSNRNTRQFAERTAVNTPIQGTAADLIKLAMINVDNALNKNELQSRMLLSVHDELIFEVPPEEIETVKKLVQEIMEGVWPLKVPLKVNMGVGDNWAEAH